MSERIPPDAPADDFDELAPQGSGLQQFTFLLDPLGILRRRWRWMLAAAFAAALIATGVVLLWPERYEATAKILQSGQRIPQSFVRSTIEESVAEQMNALVSEVLSRDSLLAVIEKHNLAAELGPELPTAQLIAAVTGNVTVSTEQAFGGGRRREPDARVIAIRYQSKDPQTAAAVANDLASRLTAANLRRRSQQARLTTEFLRREMERAEEALAEQSNRIAEFQQQHRGELPSELGANIARLERLQQERESLVMQIQEAENRLLVLRGQGGDDSRMQLLAELRSRLANELAVNTPEHPNVIGLKTQIEVLEEQLSEGQPSIQRSGTNPLVASAERELRALRERLAGVTAKIEDLDARVARTPERQEELAALERRAEVLRSEYMEALRKLKDAELAESLERAQQGLQLSLLEAAVPPTQPMIPRWQLLAGAVAAVLACAVGVALLLELLDPVVLSSDQLEGATGVMTLGVVPRLQ